MSEDPAARAADNAAVVTERDRPVTFRTVLAIREYRAIYASVLVSWLGDYLAKAAVTVLVYQRSESVLMSAAAFAVSFLPWIIGGTLLSALAERYPYRRVLIFADLARMVPLALLLLPQVPIPIMLVLVFLISLGTPPTQAARSALLPQVVGRDKLPTAVILNQTTGQAAQVFGYLVGAALAAGIGPRVALTVDLITFAISAALIAVGVQHRPAASARAHRSHLLDESAQGFRLVFGRRTLRSIASMIFVLTAFSIVPEGLAAAWAAQGNPDPVTRGLDQGLIMAAGPIGYVIGGLVIGRLIAPSRRDKLVRPLALLSVMPLIPALLAPPPVVVSLLVLCAGLAQGGLVPTLNAKFVLILPHGYRARAYGVMQTGTQLSQFSGVIVTGLLADRFFLPMVVGLWSIGGMLVMGWMAARWPSDRMFAAAVDAGARASAAPTQVARGVAAVPTRITPERT
ncbi:MFS transporter [Paractinoplanes rishiriensis]|uniref:MFS transporter n=1 Tax=Paractinoplanes rishiriensis TaxID=1050105 RepID=UPI0019412B66|nr:MFS transporter [Actinoplanes rishiriensis]